MQRRAAITVDARGSALSPLLKTRDAVRKAPRGAVIKVLRTHGPLRRKSACR